MDLKANRTITLGIILFASILVVSVVLLILFGHSGEVNNFLGFVITIIPITIGLLWNSRQNEAIKEDIGAVHTKVNGELDAKFDRVFTILDKLQNPVQASEITQDALPFDPTKVD